MKKVYSIAGIILLSLAVALTGSFAADGTDGSGQMNKQETAAPENGGEDQQNVGAPVIDGAQDIRPINNNMDYRERVEMQRAIQKRAAAKRNALMQAAEEQRQQAESNQ